MPGYSKTDKFLHRFFLGNYSISRALLELDQIVYGAKSNQLELAQTVLVTGLARSGTTAVMNRIFESGEYASLQYANMPFLLSPNVWNRQMKITPHERAHNDGIIIDGNSPEEFDEYFWKAITDDDYILENGLAIQELDEELLKKYQSYLRLICLAKGKQKYISKNNNNILRLHKLANLPNTRIIVLFRDPISHVSSLMKLDKKFSKNQQDDPFILEYFNFLGHHEFGLNHKPFLLNESFIEQKEKYSRNSINYWLLLWAGYYRYLLGIAKDNYIFVRFEDMISSPGKVYQYISGALQLHTAIPAREGHTPEVYPSPECDTKLLENCKIIYAELSKRLSY